MARTVTGSIVPDTSVIRKLGKRTRAMPFVVTELVDNSVDSWLDMPTNLRRGKNLIVRIDPSSDYFIVKDNAGGMTSAELFSAMRVAYSSKLERIGMYGFGLKSAAMFIGNRFEIFSLSHKKPREVSHFKFDAKKFEERAENLKSVEKAWETEIEIISQDTAAELGATFEDGHGTIIRIENETYRSAKEKGVKRRLCRTFAPMLPVERDAPILRSKALNPKMDYPKMHLFFGDDQLKAAGPFYESYKPRPKGVEVSDKKERTRGSQDSPSLDPTYVGHIVTIDEVKLPSGRTYFGRAGLADRFLAHSGEFGFDLIKRGRVVEFAATGDSVGLPKQNRYGKVIGQLFLDDFPTDHQKVSFLERDDEDEDLDVDWKAIGRRVGEKIKPLMSKSSALAEPGKAERAKVNVKTADEAGKAVQRAARSKEMKAALAAAKGGGPRTAPPPRKTLTHSQLLQIKPILSFFAKGEDADLVTSEQRIEKGYPVVDCIINTDHPFVRGLKESELALLSRFLAADAVAEVDLTNLPNTGDRFRAFKSLRAALLRGFK